MMSSPKTTLAGIGAILVAVGAAMSAMFDADPLTVPQWDVVIAAILAGIGLIFAKDSKAPGA
jgi:hypothetical protein